MNISEIISHRKSVRTFTGEALRPEEKEAVLTCAGSVENPYGIPVEYRLLD